MNALAIVAMLLMPVEPPELQARTSVGVGGAGGDWLAINGATFLVAIDPRDPDPVTNAMAVAVRWNDEANVRFDYDVHPLHVIVTRRSPWLLEIEMRKGGMKP